MKQKTKKCWVCNKKRIQNHILKVKQGKKYVCVKCICLYYVRRIKYDCN